MCQGMKREKDLLARVARGEYVINTHQVAEAIIRRRGCGLLMLVPTEGDGPSITGPEDDPGPGLSAA
jgi:hypothetical protein